MTQTFVHHIDRNRLSKVKTVRKAVAYLARCGYKTTQLEEDMVKFRKSRTFGGGWGRVTVEWIVQYVFEGRDSVQKVIDTEYVPVSKKNRGRIQQKSQSEKDTRTQLRYGRQWLETKLMYREKFEKSKFKDLYKNIDDFAKFATEEELKKLRQE